MQHIFDLNFPKTGGDVLIEGCFRTKPEDFYVNEVLGFTPTGEGEHVLLHIEKRSQNTHWVAQLIATLAGVDDRDVGVCGRKDRHACTRQWFSVYLPQRPDIDWQQLNTDDITVLDIALHQQKLRPGMHRANDFRIRLRDVRYQHTKHSLSVEDKIQLTQRFAQLATTGVPNYFGEQRFGRQGANLVEADKWLTQGKVPNRRQRSIILSSARSYLFNRVLAHRVIAGHWQAVLAGDIADVDSPTGPLWGRGRTLVSEATRLLEDTALADLHTWCDALEHRGLQQERRSLVLTPMTMSDMWEENDWIISFSLPTGSFATALLGELIMCVNKKGQLR